MRARSWIHAVALSVLSATPVFAQKQVLEEMKPIVRPANAPATIGDFITRVQSRVRPSVITVDYSTDSFIIPVAGNTGGGGGTYFRSDVAFNNDRLEDQTIAIGWLAQGQNNCSAPLQYFELAANSVTIADDFVNRSLGKQGLGGVLVLGVDSVGNLDEDAEIDGYSRIWTPQPGSPSGTTSQNFSAIAVQDSLGSLPATLMGLKQNAQFRTNVGVVNMDNVNAHTWTFTSIFTRVATTVTAQPCGMMLVGAAGNSGSPTGNAAFTVKTNDSGFWWSGFGSSTDNTTGDGWVSRAIQ